MTFLGACIIAELALFAYIIISNWREVNEQQRRRNPTRKRKQVRKF